MAFPHTRPTPLAIHTTDPELRQQNPRWIDRLEIPASFSSYLEYHLGKLGISSYGAAAHVPHYLANASFTQAAATIPSPLRGGDKGWPCPPDRTRPWRPRPTSMAIEADNPRRRDRPRALHQLEEQYDRYTEPTGEDLPSADEIAAAVERFLAQRDDGNQPPPKGE